MHRLLFVTGLAVLAVAAKPAVGPERGALLVGGGGKLSADAMAEFIRLAGGPDASIIWVPTASDLEKFPPDYLEKTVLAKAGAKNLTLLHTRDRKVADTE